MPTSKGATVEWRPVSGALGAEIRGVDLREVDDATWAEIRSIWLENLVVFFPGQALAPADHIELARRFGEPEIHPFLPKRSEDLPEIVVLDSDRGPTESWHTDVTFSATPPMASVLRMAVCPSRGGDTIWTNQYLAFEFLSPPMRELLEGLTAVHTASSFGRPDARAEHPLVRIHPETGRQALFVNREFTSHVPQLRREESDAILGFLFAWSEQPRFQCRYRWSAGAVGIWDNRCTQHFPIFDYDEHRVIERVTILGDRPFGPEVRWEPYRAVGRARSTHDREPQGPPRVDPRANSVPAGGRA